MGMFVNPNEVGLIWPEASVEGTHSADGVLFDTGWHINWPGPGQVYLSDGAIIDVVIPAAKERVAVQDALKSAGWTAPGETSAEVSALEAKIEALTSELEQAKAAEAGFDAALKKLEEKAKPAAKPAARKGG